MRQIGPLFGASHSAPHRWKRHDRPAAGAGAGPHAPIDSVAIVDGTWCPRGITGWRHRRKTTGTQAFVQIAIDADTRPVIATGDAHPGNRNDCTVYRDSDIEQELTGRPGDRRRRLPMQRRGDHPLL